MLTCAFINPSKGAEIVSPRPEKYIGMGFGIAGGTPTLALCAAVVSACFSVFTTSCVSKTESFVPPGPADDAIYSPVLDRWTRETRVFSKFQNKVEISAVLLADDMRRAVAERLSRLRGSTDGLTVLSDSSGGVRLGMLVSIFTPENPYMNLDDKSLWSLSLRIGPNQQAPMYVRRVSDKTPLQPFFSHIHQWSQDYLLVFDFPETSLQPENDRQKQLTTAEFVAQSAIARVALRWP
ncbi:MAG: hypothetical protein RI953_2589 [Pseudomonadota bacterium]